MTYFQICSADLLSAVLSDNHACGLAADGCSLILLDREARKAVRLGETLEPTSTHALARPYTCLCYDARERCFWAGYGSGRTAICQLDECFTELARYDCADCRDCRGPIRHLHHDCARDTLILTYANMVVELSKNPAHPRRVLFQQAGVSHRCCLRAGAYTCHVSARHHVEQLSITRHMHPPILVNLPEGYRVLSIAQRRDPCGDCLCMLAVRGGCHYLLRGMLVQCGSREACAPPAADCPPCGESPGWDHCEHRHPDHKHHRPGHDHEDHDHEHDHEHHHPDHGHGDHEDHDHKHDHDHHHPDHGHGNHEDHDHDHENGHEDNDHGHWTDDKDHTGGWVALPGGIYESCNNIILSVALEQAAISHILNAEGEKIQKILAVSDRPADLLAVNESVRRMVGKLTHLELALCSKLELARETLCASPGYAQAQPLATAEPSPVPVPDAEDPDDGEYIAPSPFE